MTQQLESTIKYVEVEVNSRCNRACCYCPVSILPEPDVPLYMSDAVFDKTIKELVSSKFEGVFSYHFYNEPLLRDDLEKMVDRVKHLLPETIHVLYTNGDKLSEARYHNLCNAGIDHFIITSHSRKTIPTRPKQKVLFPGNLLITNRGGTMSKLDKPLSTPCHSPNERLIVTVTGDVLICCNDAMRSFVIGNIENQNLNEIWYSPKLKYIRERLIKGKRGSASPLCKFCNDTEYKEPGHDHYKDYFSNRGTYNTVEDP